MWAKREQYGNDREKVSPTDFSSIVPHKVSFSSIRRQHHAIAPPIDQASTKKSPPNQYKYIVMQLYSLFTFCLCCLAIIWPLWLSFFIALAIDVLQKLGPSPIWLSLHQGLCLAPLVCFPHSLMRDLFFIPIFHLQTLCFYNMVTRFARCH